jgi:hypothetical protein
MYSCPKHHVFNNKKGNDNKIKVNYSFDTLTNVPLAFARVTMLVTKKEKEKKGPSLRLHICFALTIH